jgi:carbamoyl-phosphate synthase large subunit
VDLLQTGEVQFLVNTPLGRKAQLDDLSMRQVAVVQKVPYTTTIAAGAAAAEAIAVLGAGEAPVKSIQEWHALLAPSRLT